MASSYNSFYGGRRGASFVIVKSYLDIRSMTKDFEQGSSFNEVHFDEYVIINNPNKNHPDNGKLFRRGMDFNSDRTISGYITKDRNGNEVFPTKIEYEVETTPYPYTFELNTNIPAKGAEFVGTIIGPEGKAPHLTLAGYDSVAGDFSNSNENGMQTRVRYGSFGPTQTTHNETDSQHPGETQVVPNLSFPSALVPGREVVLDQVGAEVEHFNDNIEWISASLRDELNRDTIVHIGLKIPYKVTDVIAHAISPYAGQNHAYSGEPTVDYLGSRAAHPFYDKWDLGIPKGVKGDSLRDMRITTIGEFTESQNNSTQRKLYKLVPNGTDSSLYDIAEWVPATELASIDSNIDITLLQIVVCSAIVYDNYEQGQKKDFFLGYFTQLSNVQFEDGVLTLIFTSLDKNNNNKVQFSLNYVNDVELKQNGEVVFKYANASQKTSQSKIKWIKNIELVSKREVYVDLEDEEGHRQVLDFTAFQLQNPKYYGKILNPEEPLSNDRASYVPKTISTDIPDIIEEDQLHIVENGVDTIIKRAGDWNTIESDDYDGIFIQGQERQENELIIQYNVEETPGVTKKYTTFIPFVNDFQYDQDTGMISYVLAGGGTNSLTQITKINDVVLEDNGELRTYVDAIPNGLIERNEFGGIVTDTDKYHYKTNDSDSSYLKTGHIKTVESFSFITEDDITEAQRRYNNASEGSMEQKQAAQDITFFTANKGKLVVKYTDDTVEVLTEKQISMIEDFAYDPVTNTISYTNNKTPVSFNLPIMTGLDYDYEQGDIVYYITRPKTEEEQQQQQESGEQQVLEPHKVTFSNKVPFIQKVGLNQGTKELYFQFNKGADAESIVQVINSPNTNDIPFNPVDGWYKIGDMSSYPMTPLPATNFTYQELWDYLNARTNSLPTEDSQRSVISNLATDVQYIINAGGPVAADQMKMNEDEEMTNFSKNTIINVLNYIFYDGYIRIYNSQTQSFETDASESLKGYAVTIGMDASSGDKDFFVFDWGKSLQPTVATIEGENVYNGTWYFLGHLSAEGSITIASDSAVASSAPYSGYVLVASSQLNNITVTMPSYVTLERTITKIVSGKTYKNVIKGLRDNDRIKIFETTSGAGSLQIGDYTYTTSSTSEVYSRTEFNKDNAGNIGLIIGTVAGSIQIEIETNSIPNVEDDQQEPG